MAYRIELLMPTMKDGVRVKEWRAVRPVGVEKPYRFNTLTAADSTLRLISEPFNRDQYRIVEVG